MSGFAYALHKSLIGLAPVGTRATLPIGAIMRLAANAEIEVWHQRAAIGVKRLRRRISCRVALALGCCGAGGEGQCADQQGEAPSEVC